MIRSLAIATCLLVGALTSGQELPDWLVGEWERDSRGGKVVERWSAVSDRTLEGEAWRVAPDGRRRLTERLLVAEMAGGLFLIPHPVENPLPVAFALVEQAERRVVFANPEHDFPKRIGYALDGDTLTAWIADDERQIDFVFRRARSAARSDWSNMRGPYGDGSARDAGALASLELAWKHAIGPGYSGVAVADGRAVTAFSDGTNDVVAAWSTADGRELWRTPIAPTYRGHDGSTDGPVGTPNLTASRVYLMGPSGDLVALSAERGTILWRRQLKEEWAAPEPVYGFGSSVLEVDGVLVVPGGSDTHAAIGLDPADGRRLWSLGKPGVNYATPVVVDGKLLVAGARDLIAIDPREGKELWSFRHSAEPPFDPTYPQLQPLDDGVLLVFKSEAVRYRREGKGLTELWRSGALKNSVAIPVVHGDHLYGFNGTFLTCVALADGKSVWKSRTPRGRGLIRIDNRLVVLGVGGTLTLALADPAGYREIASLDVTDHGGYTAPSYADGRIYVRNLGEIASVAVGEAPPTPDMTRTSILPDSGAVADWIRRIEQADDPAPVVAEFIAAQPSFPVVDAGQVHFVYAGEGQAVSLIGQMNDDDIGEPMERVGEAQLFIRSYPTVPGGRWQYRFQVDFADSIVDPLNPRRGSGGFFESSEVTFDGFADPSFVTEQAAKKGRLEELTVRSEAYDTELAVQLYLPHGYDTDRRYPLIVMPNGEQWVEGGIVAILDRLFESGARPAIVALVPMQAWVGGSWGGRAVTLLGEELLPAIEAAYPIAERALWTVEDKAAVGMQLATASPQRYGRFAFQSPKLYFREPPSLDTVDDATAFHVSWSRYEKRSAESGTDERAQARALLERLRAAGFKTAGGEQVAGPGYRTWRTEADAILRFLTGK